MASSLAQLHHPIGYLVARFGRLVQPQGKGGYLLPLLPVREHTYSCAGFVSHLPKWGSKTSVAQGRRPGVEVACNRPRPRPRRRGLTSATAATVISNFWGTKTLLVRYHLLNVYLEYPLQMLPKHYEYSYCSPYTRFAVDVCCRRDPRARKTGS